MVSAAVHAIVGIISIVLGIGPVVVGTGAIETALGLTGVVSGIVLLVSARGLLARGPSRRTWAAIGGATMALTGAAVAVWALLSLSGCPSSSDACVPATVTTGVAGASLVVIGLASAVMIGRRSRSAFERTHRVR